MKSPISTQALVLPQTFSCAARAQPQVLYCVLILSLFSAGQIRIAWAQPVDSSWFPRPFESTFLVTRNAKEVAISKMKLKRTQTTGEYRLSQSVKGSKGLVGVLGGAISESSAFSWNGRSLVPTKFQYKRKLPFFSRKQKIKFDWEGHTANGKGPKIGKWNQTLDGGELDHMLINLALGQDLALDLPLDHTLIDKNERKHWQFELIGNEQLDLPFGKIDTVHLKRIRKSKKRESHLWLAPELNYLAVKVSHRENGNDLETILTSHQFTDQD